MTLWQRFVTTFREDQDLLVKEFADKNKGYNFRPIVSNYQGNPQTVITHPKGEPQQYARLPKLPQNMSSLCNDRHLPAVALTLASILHASAHRQISAVVPAQHCISSILQFT